MANKAADAASNVLRLSIDSKAKVKIGNLSRKGKARGLKAQQADDHDDHWDAVRSNRTQFIKRIAQFCQTTGLQVQLIYYPLITASTILSSDAGPRWRTIGMVLLNTIEEALQWAAKMTWHGFEPLVHLVDGFYPKKVKLSKDELEPFEQQWQRSEKLPEWDITIVPL